MLDVICGALGAFLIILIMVMDSSKDSAKLKERVKAMEASVQAMDRQILKAQKMVEEMEKQLGLSFKDKKLVFVMDVSGSMGDDGKLGQVVMGIKMLVATMTPDYAADVVLFPVGPSGGFQAMWDGLRPVTEDRKYEIYGYLSRIAAVNGGTPAVEALRHAISSYPDAGAVVFLSDGQPTGPGGTSALARPELDAAVDELTRLNGGRKRVNTIGVGKDFVDRQSQPDAVAFMRGLAGRNGGVYVGF